MSAQQPAGVEALLSNSAWIRPLAASLVRDAASVDDLIQEAWAEVLRRPPGEVANAAGWLRTTLRRVVAKQRESERSRRVRERLAARAEALAPEHELEERARLHRDLLDHVLALDEADRSVLLQRFYENLPQSEIARRSGAPVATVKSRLQRALERLRQRLDERFEDRDQWALALLVFAHPGDGVPVTAVGASFVGWGAAKLVAALLALLSALWFAVQLADGDELQGAQAQALVSREGAALAAGAEQQASADAAAPSASVRAPVSSSPRADNDSGVRVRLVREVDGAPLADARVEYLSLTRWSFFGLWGGTNIERGEARSNASGDVRLPDTGEYVLRVKHGDEPPIGGAVEVERAGQTVTTTAFGALDVAVSTASGAPASGVSLQLLFGDGQSRWFFEEVAKDARELHDCFELSDAQLEFTPLTSSFEWNSTRSFLRLKGASAAELLPLAGLGEPRFTDASGVAHWPHVPAGWSVRAVATSGASIQSPAAPTEQDAQRIQALRDTGLDESLPVAVKAAEAARLELKLENVCEVVGRVLDGGHPWSGALEVRLKHSVPTGPFEAVLHKERAVPCGADGRFAFPGIRPGAKTLEIEWLTAGGELVSIERRFDVAADQALDLGTIVPADTLVEFTAVAVDARGVQLDADALLTWEALDTTAPAGTRPLCAEAHLRGKDHSRLRAFDVPFGSSLRVRGLEPDTWSASVLAWKLAPRSTDWRVSDESSECPFDVPTSRPVTLALELRELTSVHVRVDAPRGGPQRAANVTFVSATQRKGGARTKLRTGSECELRVEAGEYVAVAHTTDDGASLYAIACWNAAQGGSLNLELAPAACLRGTLELTGPRQVSVVSASLPELGSGRSFSSIWFTQVAEDGSFELRGLPPHTELELRLPHSAVESRARRITTGAAGQTLELTAQ
jgi:RNA polymerase sigma-70 factor (ECF subfamily)